MHHAGPLRLSRDNACPGPRDLQAVSDCSAVLAALILAARLFSLITEVEIVNARACPPCLFGDKPDSDIQGGAG